MTTGLILFLGETYGAELFSVRIPTLEALESQCVLTFSIPFTPTRPDLSLLSYT
jgi:hypothetical protein